MSADTTRSSGSKRGLESRNTIFWLECVHPVMYLNCVCVDRRVVTQLHCGYGEAKLSEEASIYNCVKEVLRMPVCAFVFVFAFVGMLCLCLRARARVCVEGGVCLSDFGEYLTNLSLYLRFLFALSLTHRRS